MLSDALPLTSVTTPSVVAPSRNVTAPVGTPAPDVTVELSVTVCPTVEGFGVDVRLVDVAATAGALTICVTVGDVLAANAALPNPDRKSTRLNSSHVEISYAVFCLKKK